jgi:CubicO group peptidase (beta-lactamase class C family)
MAGLGIRSAGMAAVLAAYGAFAAAPAVQAQDAYGAQVDSLFAEYATPGSPGCAVGVIREGAPAWIRGYGNGNLDHGIPLDGRSVFYLASVSKQFTAAAIVLAEAAGYLSLDDDLTRWVPELASHDAPITLRQLVHHTSGLRDYLTLIPLSGRRADDHWTDEALLGLIGRQRALNFAPGSEYLYSNTGYVLLAEVIRRATGRSLRQYADERIFQPLGMRDTHFHDDATQVVPRRVLGHARSATGWRLSHWFAFDKVGDGGLYSTLEDLARWDANFYTGQVGGAGFLARMHERGVLNSGDSIGYAAGLQLGRYRGMRTVEHGGSLAGFRTNILRVPDERFSAIVLCNTTSANASQLSRRIAEIYLGPRMEPAAAAAAPAAGAADAAAVAPLPGSRAAAFAAVRLADYVGDYHSDELEATYRLELDGGQLIIRRGAAERLPLRMAETGELGSSGTLRLRFTRENDVVTGFVLDAGRVRGLAFARICPECAHREEGSSPTARY